MHRELMLQHQTGAARGLHRSAFPQRQPGRTFLLGADLAGDVLRVPQKSCGSPPRPIGNERNRAKMLQPQGQC
jgi:hypothetical protein